MKPGLLHGALLRRYEGPRKPRALTPLNMSPAEPAEITFGKVVGEVIKRPFRKELVFVKYEHTADSRFRGA
jgi:hypothetical protein